VKAVFMQFLRFGIFLVIGACLPAVFLKAADEPATANGTAAWSSKAAAGYLDARMDWWAGWKSSARDHDTFCVSCHTAVPYAMGRPALRGALGETAVSPVEQKLVDNVAKRVRIWNELLPFYPDNPKDALKTAESRGTESILSAVVLTSYDAPGGKLSADARLALDNMWGQQLKTGDTKGSWNWLQFHNAPWEGDSQFYGSTLAALAVGRAAGDYKSTPAIQENLNLLRAYLVKERASQTLMDQVILLWASTTVPGLLTAEQQKAVISEALAKQKEDGGFSLSSFVGDWKRRDKTELETKSDGYATGVVTYVLQQAGVARDQPQMKRGLAWLSTNQDKTEGRWLAYSMNKQRDLSTDVGKFMSDAATAYAVMALKGK
jgi:squalene-hopene/tetraprenyl-beta-curcumene cyclase